jgi:uncharacterized protein YlzI (FlbEa/FlbD family)
MRGGALGDPTIAWIDGEPYIVAINSAELVNRISKLFLATLFAQITL